MAAGLWVVLLLGLVLGVGWALRPVRTTGPTTPSQAWVAAERHARRVTLVAWCVLIPVPLLVLALSTPLLPGVTLGAVTAALPSLAGIGFLAVHVAGELTWPRPDGPVRRAPLVRRGIRDVAPRALSVLTGVWVALLALLLVVCGAAAGTGGRSLSYAYAAGAVRTTSPFPGWYYGRWIGVPLVVLVAGTIAVLALVARRPAVADTDPADDLTLRRTSARRVLAGIQLTVAWTFAACLLVAANAVRGVQPRWADAFGPGSSAAVASTVAVVAVAIVLAAPVVALRSSRASRVTATEAAARSQVVA
ncbi:MAG: hypothetical protein ABWY33_10975 [Cellulomonas sp.]